ncbi:hypothetical protein DM01DRAFT_1300121 [Hesseltinella vesiculosa]|uniref:Uncharacterized protein n=1 Tax=Hesseltinella vesiculosa TaxID=101127 RepID=A0A1X2GSA9_9FUNG|nr:hypothetical protein DM01DRAFT_1300121 [Hesseltinella vesiculosa]
MTNQQPYIVSCPTKLMTLQDIILDTPVWRANVIHVEEQIDAFEKWLDTFVRTLRYYLEALSKVNTQASLLCKQLVLSNMDDALINVQVADPVSSAFTTVLQSDLQAKMKLVENLDETVLQPLQALLKTDIKDFKDARRQFDRNLDKYENHLTRYSILSKQKEPSSLREDAFQLFDVQKSFLRGCRTFYFDLTRFKSTVEQTLIQCFTYAVMDHLDTLDNSMQTTNALRTKIPGWRQWLEESKSVFAFQLEHMELATKAFEDVQIRHLRPHRSLKRYSTTSNDQMMAINNNSADSFHSADGDMPASPPPTIPSASNGAKQGYLFYRQTVGKSARSTWVRRWFFLKNGWFGSVFTSTVNKRKGCVVMGDRISVKSSHCRVYTDIDRRYCFEVTSTDGSSMLLQAETDSDMQQWIWALEQEKEKALTQDSPTTATPTSELTPTASTPYPLLSPQAHVVTRTDDMGDTSTLVAVSTVFPVFSPSSSVEKTDPVAQKHLQVDNTTMSVLTDLLLTHAHPKEDDSPLPNLPLPPLPSTSSVSASDPPTGNSDDLLTAKSSSPHGSTTSLASIKSTAPSEAVSEAASRRSHQPPSVPAAWSMPWLISALSPGTMDTTPDNGWIIKAPSASEPDYHIIWPNKLEQSVPDVTLDRYTEALQESNRELRRYFAGVPIDEIVLQVFSSSLYRHPNEMVMADGDCLDDVGLQENEVCLTQNGNGYHGVVYLTQKSLWFYSCRWLNCVNAVVIPLRNIKSIRLEKVLSAKSQGMLMYINAKPNPIRTFCFGTWLEPAELIGERIRLAIESAKGTAKQDTQSLYDAIYNTHLSKVRTVPPTSHVTTFSTTIPTVTPVTVQVQQRSSVDNTSSSEHPSDDNASSSSISDVTKLSSSPATDALTAAMECARENAAKTIKSQQLRPARGLDGHAITPSTSSSSASHPDAPQAALQHHSSTAVRLKPPTELPVQCECDDHLDKIEADLDLQISAQDLFVAMVEDASSHRLWSNLNKKKGNSEPTWTPWEANSDGVKQRVLTYTMPVTNPMVKSKETEVIETQTIVKEDLGRRYVITTETKAPNLPYADAFIPIIKLCITYISPTSCRLACYIGVKWLKSIMVKGMVNKAAMKGMAETINTLVPIVEQLATPKDHPTSKKKSTRRTTKEELAQRAPLENPHHRRKQSDTKEAPNVTWATLCTTLFSLTSTSPLMLVAMFLVLLSMLLISGKFYHRSASLPDNFGPKMTWRAVQLTDLEPLVNGKPMDQSNSSVYQIFKKSRSDMIGWKYHWVNVRHRLMAAELIYTREQLAALRYELLTSFRLLNTMDQRLLESEYWNWLLDQRVRCFADTEDQLHSTKQLCQEVQVELDQLL